jgi:hypothetical protein
MLLWLGIRRLLVRVSGWRVVRRCGCLLRSSRLFRRMLGRRILRRPVLRRRVTRVSSVRANRSSPRPLSHRSRKESLPTRNRRRGCRLNR